jgi:RecA/RadA recombinase
MAKKPTTTTGGSFTSLRDRLLATSRIKETAIISDSKIYGKSEYVSTSVPIINGAFSGRLDGGFDAGLTMLAAPSRHFKSSFAILLIKAYLQKYPDAVCIFYDSEFGSPENYFADVDLSRIIWTPILNIEELKFDLIQQLEGIKREEKVIIAIDSIGNLASKKELEDALEGKSVADMTRAKALKSLWRMVTPYLNMRDVPLIAVNHTYQTQEMYSKTEVSGGTGGVYSSDNIWTIGKRQDKDGTELVGNDFVINIFKSRTIRERSSFVVNVSFEKGINKWSGLMDFALEANFVAKPAKGWYQKVDQDTGELVGKKYQLDNTNNAAFWQPLLEDERFQTAFEKKYKITSLNNEAEEQEENTLEIPEEE